MHREQLVCTVSGVQLLANNDAIPQLLQAVVQHLAGLSTAAARQRQTIRNCCYALLGIVREFLVGPAHHQGTTALVLQQLPLLLQFVLEGGDRLANAAYKLADDVAEYALDHAALHPALMQRRSVDLLVQRDLWTCWFRE